MPRYDWRSPANRVLFGRDAGLDRGLVGEWRFDPVSGLVLPDCSGYGNHGTLINTPTWLATKIGPVLEFDRASSERVDLNISIPLASPGAVTFEALAWGNPWNAGDGTSRNLWIYRIDDNNYWRLQTGRYTTDYLQTVATLGGVWKYVKVANVDRPIDQVWTHIVCTWQGTTVRVYLNGALKKESAVHHDLAAYGTFGMLRLCVGYGGTADYFNGRVALFRAYNRVPSAAEVRRRYEICLQRPREASVWMIPWMAPDVAVAAERVITSFFG